MKARTPTTSPRSPRSIPICSASRSSRPTVRSTPPATSRPRSRSSRSRRCSRWRESFRIPARPTIEKNMGVDATGQVVQLDRRHRAVQRHRDEPARQRRRDHDDEHGRRRHCRRDLVEDHRTRYDDFAGRKLTVLEDVYKSEAATNQRNQAIGALMFAYGHISANPAAGHRPLHATVLRRRQRARPRDDGGDAGERRRESGDRPSGAVGGQHVPAILAVMATAGLYDDSGKWLYATGLPAKSGVGGGLIAVSPGNFGIAVDLAAARLRRQQRARAEGDHRHLGGAGRQSVHQPGAQHDSQKALIVRRSVRGTGRVGVETRLARI